MNVVVIGEMPLVGDVAQRTLTAEHSVTVQLVEDLAGAVDGGALAAEWSMADVVVELIGEGAATKRRLLDAIEAAVPSTCLILVLALPQSVTMAAAGRTRPARFVGFGLVPPVPETAGLVEVARGLNTDDASLAAAIRFWATLGFEAVAVADGPGLVRARTVCCLINEAASALMDGVASAADIDQAMQLGTNYPHGPLAWGDLMGLDMVLGVMEGLAREWGEDRYRPTPLLRQLVAAGRLGRKSGQGFFNYDEA